jgi:hypothetical protein
MSKENNIKAITPARRGFVLPAGLFKYFETEVRILPKEDHPNGYITFDLPMLISVLRSKDVQKAGELANALEKMGKAGGEFVIMQG